jgi:hypothetical protein
MDHEIPKDPVRLLSPVPWFISLSLSQQAVKSRQKMNIKNIFIMFVQISLKGILYS